jgi:hypothetical protein
MSRGSASSPLAMLGQLYFLLANYTYKVKKKVKQSRYTPWRRLGEEEVLAPTHSRPRH